MGWKWLCWSTRSTRTRMLLSGFKWEWTHWWRNEMKNENRFAKSMKTQHPSLDIITAIKAERIYYIARERKQSASLCLLPCGRLWAEGRCWKTTGKWRHRMNRWLIGKRGYKIYVPSVSGRWHPDLRTQSADNSPGLMRPKRINKNWNMASTQRRLFHFYGLYHLWHKPH